MSGMDMLDMLPSDKDRVITSLREEVTYWKRRSEILEEYCRGVRKLIDDDTIKNFVKDYSESNITKDEPVVTQDKVENQEETSPVVVSTDTASADTEDYKLIAEKAKAENAVLREEIESLHEAMRFIQVLSRPDSQSKTPKVTGSIQ